MPVPRPSPRRLVVWVFRVDAVALQNPTPTIGLSETRRARGDSSGAPCARVRDGSPCWSDTAVAVPSSRRTTSIRLMPSSSNSAAAMAAERFAPTSLWIRKTAPRVRAAQTCGSESCRNVCQRGWERGSVLRLNTHILDVFRVGPKRTPGLADVDEVRDASRIRGQHVHRRAAPADPQISRQLRGVGAVLTRRVEHCGQVVSSTAPPPRPPVVTPSSSERCSSIAGTACGAPLASRAATASLMRLCGIVCGDCVSIRDACR